ncbi:MAG: hypothetical protein AB7I48_05950 [Planctomycetaceae bacterium]
MNFTSEQRSEAERQLRENPGSRRVSVTLMPEQRDEFRRTVDAELARQDDVIRDSQSLVRALGEQTFSGELRRTISRSGIPRDDLAKAIGVEPGQLRDFLWGRDVLPTDAVDRLMNELRLLPRLETQLSRPGTA